MTGRRDNLEVRLLSKIQRDQHVQHHKSACPRAFSTLSALSVNMVFNVHRNRTAYSGRGERGGRGYGGWGKREIIYLSLHCHQQNDSCIKMDSDESHFNVSLTVKENVTIKTKCPQTATFLKREESRSGIEPGIFCLPAVARPKRLT